MGARFAKAILHIGQHKTGTTSIQHALASNRAALASEGVIYPRLPGWPDAHHALAPALLGVENASAYVRRRLGGQDAAALRVSRRAVADLRALARAHPGATLVLSSEAFFRVLPGPARDRVVETLLALAETVRVIAYIRPPAEFYLSAVNTMVQAMQPIQPPARGGRRGTLAQYGTLPGVSVSVHPFARATLIGEDAVEDFAHRALGLSGTALPNRPRHGLNQTLSAEALALFQDYAAWRGHGDGGPLGPRALLARQTLRRLDRRLPGYRRPRLHPGLADEILRHSSDMRWLRDAYGCVFADLDYGIAGTGARVDFADHTRISDLCPLDVDRMTRLRARWWRV